MSMSIERHSPLSPLPAEEAAPRATLSSTLSDTRIVAVLRATDSRYCSSVISTLVAAGIRSVELTLTTPGTLAALPRTVADTPDAEIGVGTVLTEADARLAVAGGAKFLVSPGLRPAVLRAAHSTSTPIYPGAMTPTEVQNAWDLGAAAVKLFPAATLGPDYVRHLAGPFPHVKLMPSGGVVLEDIASWLRAGCVAVSLGGPLIGDALEGGSLRALRARAERAVSAVQETRGDS